MIPAGYIVHDHHSVDHGSRQAGRHGRHGIGALAQSLLPNSQASDRQTDRQSTT